MHQHRLPPHRRPSDRRGVQCFIQPRAHSHQPVQVHRLRPQPNGEDHFRETQLPVQSRHSLNLSAFVPRHCTFAHVQQVRTGGGIIELQTQSQINFLNVQDWQRKLWLVKADKQECTLSIWLYMGHRERSQPSETRIIFWLDCNSLLNDKAQLTSAKCKLKLNALWPLTILLFPEKTSWILTNWKPSWKPAYAELFSPKQKWELLQNK